MFHVCGTVHQDVAGSDHAPVSLTLTTSTTNGVPPEQLIQRAEALGTSQYFRPALPNHRMRKSIGHKEVDKEMFTRFMQNVSPPMSNDENDPNVLVSGGCDAIMNIGEKCVKEVPATGSQWDRTQPRWARIMQEKDSRLLWKSIKWKY